MLFLTDEEFDEMKDQIIEKRMMCDTTGVDELALFMEHDTGAVKEQRDAGWSCSSHKNIHQISSIVIWFESCQTNE